MRIRNRPGRGPARRAASLRAGYFVGILWAVAGCLGAPAVASAQPALWSGWGESLSRADQWRIVVSPYTQHWRPSDEHRHVWAFGAERAGADGRFWGLSYFTNSFGQPSAYAYIGQRYGGVLGQPAMYLQWSGGVMYGYTGKYQHKVPLNVRGFSPGFVPSLGFQVTPRTSVQYNLLGDAGVMFQFTHDWR